jgi:pimeloyl-ACP methyl ester carboxylesterase
MGRPTVFIVPGIYEGPDVFVPLEEALKSKGYKVHTTHLLSTGTASPNNPSMSDDAAFIASELSRAVDEAGADGVVAFLHSAGGFLGSMAMRGLSARARGAEGRAGGVRAIVFLVAGILPEGVAHKHLPFMEFHGFEGYHVARDPRRLFFNDMSDAEAERWLPKLGRQPSEGWNQEVSFAGWREVPSVFIVTEEDQVIPLPMQEHMAQTAGSEVIRLKAGHMAQLSQTAEVARIVDEEATKLG